ncbi:TetR/AcrR family transcriptional regulator [Micromonospora sp. KC606]|uniref:TetR/AcrR family transcriptional regulator n=1 Tax=Micromonospora sp. KC606 TaxID=2530379 RepID=UPI001047EB4D|nr:TetR/AcrR family transcriptional regulator [Micromonospora sp. KC606]TDC73355.1 TetR/AcrR family transcriptional regulator [Micromonospora sp. KC606]
METPAPTTRFADPPAGTPRRPGGRSARVRRRVLDTVITLLVERGYDALTVDAVAERSGVHRTTVYRRWRDVGGLLADVLAEATGDDWQPRDTGSLRGDLEAINQEVHEALTAEPPLTGALIAASFRSPPAAAALRAFWADRYERCAVVVARAVARGEAPAGTDARALLVAATAPVYHELLLLRSGADLTVAAQAARTAAVAARAGAFVTA